MPQLWLSPIQTNEPVTIGADRLAIEANAPEWISFRQSLQAIHPRLLPLFKAQLLTAADGDEDSQCGTEFEQELELEQEGAIVFDGGAAGGLSHCAEAFLDRLLEPEEALRLWETAHHSSLTSNELADVTQRVWLDMLLGWWRQGYRPVLLAER